MSQKKTIEKFEWRFIQKIEEKETNLKVDNFKILVKFSFSDNTVCLFNTNYSAFKKLVEELETSLGSFNSTFSRRVNKFSIK
jgi:hypothetical protein